MKCVNAILTAASCRPMFPMVTPPEKKTHGSQERTNRKSGSVYLVNQNIVAIHNHSSSDNLQNVTSFNGWHGSAKHFTSRKQVLAYPQLIKKPVVSLIAQNLNGM